MVKLHNQLQSLIISSILFAWFCRFTLLFNINFSDTTADYEEIVEPPSQRKLAKPFMVSSLSVDPLLLGSHSHFDSSASSLNFTDSEADHKIQGIPAVSPSGYSCDLLSLLPKKLLVHAQQNCDSFSKDVLQRSKSAEQICEAENNLTNHNPIFHSLR